MDNIAPKPYNELGYLLTQVSFLKQRIINAALKDADITYIQFVILAAVMELGTEGAVVTQQLVADQRRLDKAMVSNVVKTLENKSLLFREPHPADKRAVILSLTLTGRDKVMAAKKVAHDIDIRFFDGIDRSQLQKILTQLLRNDNKQNE